MPASENVSTVDGIKNLVSDAFKWLKQLPGSTAQSVAQVVTGAPAQAGTLPPNAVATASPLPTMMNSTGGLIHPLAGKGTNTSGFGMRNHPTKGGKRMHTGQDFGASQGTPIVAAAGGRVVENKNDQNGYGNYVVIEHMSGGQKIETLYGHMKDPSPLQFGASVQQGQQIGLVGSTGSSTGPHLHFEVIVNGKPQDPMAFLPKGDTQKA
jgi:murein DD-endopeptidase MepM/ murein hydrolase activator NlpD